MPTCYYITLLSEVNPLINIQAHNLYLDAKCVATPVPIDRPNTIIFYYFHFPNLIKKLIINYASFINIFYYGLPSYNP